jgi:hypothetical protein
MIDRMDAIPLHFYNIFCERVLVSYIFQSLVTPRTASLVGGEKERALLI